MSVPIVPFSLFLAAFIAMIVYVVGLIIMARNKDYLKEKKLEDKCNFILLILLAATFLVVKFIAESLG